MPKLGLSSKLSSSALVTPGIVTDNLVMKHMYPAETVQPLSDGAVKLVRTDDNNGDYIDTGTSLSTGTVISVACWIRPSGATNEYMGIIGPKVTDEHSSNVWLLRRDNGNKYQFIVDWSNKVEIASTLVEDGEWHHLCGTYDGSNIKFYLDGVLQGTQAESSHDVSCENIYLGTYWMDTNVRKYYFDGHMCNAAVWTGALSSAQIKSIMWKQYADLTDSDKDAGTTGSSNLVSWWNLDTAYDSFVFDNHHGGGDSLGSNLWVNSDSVTTGSGWTWDGSVGHAQSDDTNAGDFSQPETIDGNTVYKTVYTVSDYVKGQVRIKLNSANDSNDYYGVGTTRTANGTYTEYIRTSSTGGSELFNHIQFQTYGSTDDNFKVSDIQVYKVNGNTGTLT